MKKLFVSVPMKDRAEEEIRVSIEKMKKIAEAFEDEELELIDSYIEDNPPENNHAAIWYLGESLKKLSTADVFIGIDDVWEWHGCQVETDVARLYNIKRYCVPVGIVISNYKELMVAKREEAHCNAHQIF